MGDPQSMSGIIDAIRQRWGPGGIRRASDAPLLANQPLATGVAALDALLGGGLPRGRVTELIAATTAGQLAISAGAIHSIQAAAGQAAYLDLDHAVDLEELDRRGVRLGDLAVLQPLSISDGLSMAAALLRGRAADLVVVDALHAGWSPADLAALDDSLREWTLRLPSSHAAVLLIVTVEALDRYPERLAFVGHLVGLRLALGLEHWRLVRGRVAGYRVRAEVLKSRSGAPGGSTVFDIRHEAAGGRP